MKIFSWLCLVSLIGNTVSFALDKGHADRPGFTLTVAATRGDNKTWIDFPTRSVATLPNFTQSAGEELNAFGGI